MGQSIDVLLYGSRIPEGVDIYKLIERWEKLVAPKVEAYEARIRGRTNHSWGLARDGFVPQRPSPDDAKPDPLVGFYVCRGYHDNADSHSFPAMTLAEMRKTEPAASAIKRCRRRWARFARWARSRGVALGKARIWRTRTEVA
jgi:hypothetical protein